MISNYPTISIVFDRRKKSSLTRKGTIEIRICHNYKQKYISTGIRVFNNQWKKQRIVNAEDSIQLNAHINQMIADIRTVINEMIKDGKIEIEAIGQKLEDIGKEKLSLLEYMEKRASIRKYGKAQDTQERYDRFIRLFKEWGRIVSFDDINDENIIAYDRYLDSLHMKPYSKWQNYHRFLNSFIIDAINEGLLSRNPYKWININKDKTSKGIERCLTPEEFKRLMEAAMPTQSLERVKDLFIFQVYTCLSYRDLANFDSSQIVSIKGRKAYTGKREKTGVSFTIPLLPQAIAVLKKYHNTLPIISNVKYNEYLKIVAQASGIDKPISTHWARHTGATMLLNDGIDIKIISRICGHSSTRITEQVYAKLLDETIVDAVFKNSPAFSGKGEKSKPKI